MLCHVFKDTSFKCVRKLIRAGWWREPTIMRLLLYVATHCFTSENVENVVRFMYEYGMLGLRQDWPAYVTTTTFYYNNFLCSI